MIYTAYPNWGKVFMGCGLMMRKVTLASLHELEVPLLTLTP